MFSIILSFFCKVLSLFYFIYSYISAISNLFISIYHLHILKFVTYHLNLNNLLFYFLLMNKLNVYIILHILSLLLLKLFFLIKKCLRVSPTNFPHTTGWKPLHFMIYFLILSFLPIQYCRLLSNWLYNLCNRNFKC